jgi:hypothetical protein
MAQKAGSSDSECVFRDSTQVLTKYRLSTTDEAAETCILVRSFLNQPGFSFTKFIVEFEGFLNGNQSILNLVMCRDDENGS